MLFIRRIIWLDPVLVYLDMQKGKRQLQLGQNWLCLKHAIQKPFLNLFNGKEVEKVNG